VWVREIGFLFWITDHPILNLVHHPGGVNLLAIVARLISAHGAVAGNKKAPENGRLSVR